MSLQVWLPLNGNTNNQGLSSVITATSNVTIDNAGKIGQCYSFNGNNSYISLQDNSLYSTIKGGTQPFSLTFWVYHADSTRAVIFGDYRLSGTINFNVELTTAHKIRFYWAGTPDKTFSTALTVETWTHIAVIYTGTHIKIYKNGILNGDDIWTGPLVERTKTSGKYYLGRDNRTGTTVLNGKLNDFRLYDHALSNKEVEEIAKGLVLHYPLNNYYLTDNIALNTNTSSLLWKYNEASGGTTRTTVVEDGIICNKITRNNNIHSGWDYLSYESINREKIKTNTTYTISFDIKASFSGIIGINGFVKGDATNYLSASNKIIQNSFTAGEWSKIIFQTTTKADFTGISTGQILYFRCNGLQDTGVWAMFKNLKVEEGTIATVWSPALTDSLYSQLNYNNKIIYDTSGYQNNGEMNNNLIAITPSPRYDCTLSFNNNYIDTNMEITTTDSTISLWINMSDMANKHILDMRNNNGLGKQPIYSYSDGHIQTGGSTAYVNSNNGLIEINKWIHLCLVQEGNILKIYKNGELFQSISCNNTPIIKPTIFARYTHINIPSGQLSDFRIYTTALSEKQIKELYNIPMQIDSSGTVYVRELVES